MSEHTHTILVYSSIALLIIVLLFLVVKELFSAVEQHRCKCKDPVRDKDDCMKCGGYID